MSKRTVIDCDRCGMGPIAAPVSVSVRIGRLPCPAGGPSEVDTADLDLCSSCAAWAFGQVARHLNDSAGRELVSEVRERRKKGVPLT